MKKIFFLSLATVFAFATKAQNNFGLQGTTPLITTGDLIIKANNSNFGLSKPAAPPTNKPLDPRVSILGATGQDGIVVRTSTSASFNGYAGFFSNTKLGGAPSPKFGVYGECLPPAIASGVTLNSYGGYFKATGLGPNETAYGVVGIAQSCGSVFGVYGEAVDGTNCPPLNIPKWAGYFKGNTNVTANFNLGGAFMPNNNAGTAGFILKSNGANVAPSWIDPATIATPNAWKLDGNANATGSSFLGTTNLVDLVLKSNNYEALRITKAGIQYFTSPQGYGTYFKTTSDIGNIVTLSCDPTFPNGNPKIAINFRAGPTATSTDLGMLSAKKLEGVKLTSLEGPTEIVSKEYEIVLNSGNGFLTQQQQKNVVIRSGNIGIGLAQFEIPQARLHIKSLTPNTSGIKLNDLNSNSPVTTVADNLLSKASGGGSIQAGNNVTINGAGTTASPYIINANLPNAPIVNWTASTVGSDNITNTNTGGVVIGSGLQVLPSGYKLYVENGILTEKVKVVLKSSVNWADYVFNKEYTLKPLAEVEQFVTTNKHLPGVPSATQLVNEGGVDVAQMLSKQMEKIEELTLYLIELNKKVEKLEKENATIKANK
jgi:hypothetical protein